MKKVDIINILLKSCVFAAIFSLLAQIISDGAIDWAIAPMRFLVAYGVSLVINFTVPAAKWGAALAKKLRCRPGGPAFTAVIYGVVSVVFCLLMVTAMSLINACVIGGAPVAPVLAFAAQTMHIYILICFILCYIVIKPVVKLAGKLAKDSVSA